MLSDFTRVANAIAATTKKSEKERLLADYLVTLDDASLERAVVFFAGASDGRPSEMRSSRQAGGPRRSSGRSIRSTPTSATRWLSFSRSQVAGRRSQET
jgi:hypothetical protein